MVVLRPLHEVGAELFEDHTALMEGELLQFGDADRARMFVDGGEVEAGRTDLVKELTGGGVVDGAGGLGRTGRVPGSCHIGTENFGHALLSLVKRRLPVHGDRIRHRCRFLHNILTNRSVIVIGRRRRRSRAQDAADASAQE